MSTDGRGDVDDVGLEGEVPGIEEFHRRIRAVAQERACTRGDKEFVVFAGDRQQGRSGRTEVGLEGRVERDVARVVEEQVELVSARSGRAIRAASR